MKGLWPFRRDKIGGILYLPWWFCLLILIPYTAAVVYLVWLSVPK